MAGDSAGLFDRQQQHIAVAVGADRPDLLEMSGFPEAAYGVGLLLF
jgi:hypothetical protein